jgi:methylated-DNA-protein-cysteine methyltransferase related protein
LKTITSPAASSKPTAASGCNEVTPRERIWQVVAAIPGGVVATYGQVAELAGLARGARFAGAVLRDLPDDSRIAWHRVLNAQGRIALPADSPCAIEQRERLEAEGILFINGRVNLRAYRWNP